MTLIVHLAQSILGLEVLLKRKVYFDKMTEIQEKEKMPYINSNYLEYILYVFQDEEHYTSKGWFILNREITNYFKENWEIAPN